MKTSKKIGLGFLGLIVGVLAFAILASPPKALAANNDGINNIKVCIDSLRFVSIAEIDCDYQGSPISFIDQNPTDGQPNYAPPSGLFCTNNQTYSVAGPRSATQQPLYPINPSPHTGVTLNIGGRHLGVGDLTASITATVYLSYPKPATSDCVPFGTPQGASNYSTPAQKQTTNLPQHVGVGQTGAIINFLQWSGDSISHLEGVSSDSSIGKHDYTRITGEDAGNGTYLFASEDFNASNSNCSGSVIAVSVDGRSGKEYQITKGSGALPADLKRLLQGTGCTANGGAANNFGLLSSGTAFGILGLPPTLTEDTSGVAGQPETASTKSQNCEQNFNHPFGWIMCPALRLADGAAGYLNRFVEGQLCFKTGDSNPDQSGTQSSTGGVVCDGKNNLNDSVKVSWGIMKNIASALLVIVMLGMVIAQAVRSEKIDAYTVRKLLPRIVAAVILIQLSWVLFKWMIDLSNDVGFAIRDLLFAPFGGEDNMRLDKMVQHGVNVATGGSAVGEFAFQFFVILAGAGLALANIPGLLVLGVFVVFSLLTAFFVLILRKILILMLVILAPIALIAWILPGTENYWKFWKDNFIKLLAMFPLIMAFIAAGRIFAFITSGGAAPAVLFRPHLAVAHLGNLPVPYVANVSGFADLAIIVFAFFGPYFLLPKTFQWGGSIMRAAASGAYSVSDRLRKKTEEPVHGIGERWQGRRAKKYDPSAKWYRFDKRGLRRLQSGHYLPTKRSQLLSIATGDKWAEERNQEMVALAARKREKATASGRDIMAGKQQALDTLESSLKPRRTRVPGVGGRVPGLKKTDLHQRQAENAIKDLINTNSFFELENMRVKIPDEEAEGGFRDGKVWETEEWRNALAGSPELYSKVASSRPDWAPHRLRTGLPKYRGEQKVAKIEQNVRREGAAVGASEEDMQEEIKRRTGLVEYNIRMADGDEVAQDALAFSEVVGEMDTRQLNSIHPMFFKRIAETAAQASRYEQLAATAATEEEHELNLEKAELMRKPAVELVTFLQKTAEKGGSFQVANLMGGGEMREYVDTAISASLPEVKLRPGQPPFPKDSAPYKLEDILDLRSPEARREAEARARGARAPTQQEEQRAQQQRRPAFQRDPRTGGTVITMPITRQPPGSTGSSYTGQPPNTDTEGGFTVQHDEPPPAPGNGEFTNEDFGSDGRYPPPDVPPANDR